MADAMQVDFLVAGLVGTDGLPLVSGTVEFFETDGVTPKDIWEDADKNTIAANPITLDIRGTAKAFADGLYSIVIKDSSGSVVDTWESVSFNIGGGGGGGSSFGIDASQFGNGNDSDAISQAVASALGADATVFLIPQQWDIDANLTIPSNINLEFLYGAYAQVQAGITLDIQGKLEAPLYNIFRGPGTVTLDSTINDIPSIWLQTAVDGNRFFLGDVAFDTDLLFVDSVNNRIGISNSTPSTLLDIREANATIVLNGRDAATNGVLSSLNMFGAKNADDEAFGAIGFNNYDDAGLGTDILSASIAALRSTVDGSALVFSTNTGGGAPLERLRIDSLGNVGIGTSSPDFTLDVAGDIRIEDTGNLRFFGTGAGDSDISLTRSAVNTLQIDGDFDLNSNDILNANSISATNLTGTLTTAAQPNVTSLGLLTGITSSGDLDLQGTANIIDSVSNTIELLTWDFTPTLLTFPVGAQINTEGALGARWEWNNSTITGENGSNFFLELDRTNGKITAERSQIGRPIIKVDPGATAGTRINAAITELGAGGGIVYCPLGTYQIDVAITMTDRVELIGDGSNATTFESNGAAAEMLNGGNEESRIKGINFDGDAGTTSTICISSSSARIEQCEFSGASSSLLFSSGGPSGIYNCIFTVPANSGGINDLISDSIVENCVFSGDAATSVGINPRNDNVVIRSNTFSNFLSGILLDTADVDNFQINNNIFNTCGTAINGGVVQSDDIKVLNNVFDSCSISAIALGRVFNYVIDNNTIKNQTGTSAISIDRTIDGKIINNFISDANVTTVINPASGSEASERVTFICEGNSIKDSSFSSAVNVITLTTLDINNVVRVSGNQVINSTVNSDVIITGPSHTEIVNNQLINTTTNGATVDLISCSGSECNISGNLISGITSGATDTVSVITFIDDNNVVSNNVIVADITSSNDFTGIREISAQIGNIHNNRINVINSGAGTGNAFSVAMTNGVATGNTYFGSDALGTLTISAGIVANNDG